MNKSFSDPPGEEHSEPPIRQGLISKTFFMDFGHTNTLKPGRTEIIYIDLGFHLGATD